MGDLDFYQSATPSVIVDDVTGSRLKPESDGSLPNDLTKVGGTAITLGQKLASASLPVVLSSDSAGTLTANQGLPNTVPNAWPIKLTDGTNTASVDPASFSLVTTDFIHYFTELGRSFLGQDYATGIANNATRDILIITGTKSMHVRFSLSTLGGNYTLFEAPTTTANGTSITIVNRNRVFSATTSLATMFFSPTVTATGTQLVLLWLGSSGNKAGGDVFSTNEEFILKPSTKYLIRFTSTASSNISSTVVLFHEVV
jgi:hypothetical protein